VNYPRMSMYNDARIYILEETLPFQMDHKRRRIERARRNLECISYNYKDLAKLAHILFRIFYFCKVRGHMGSQNVHKLAMN